MRLTSCYHVFTHFDLFVGMGGMSLGLSKGQARVGNTRATMECIGGVDCWPTAIKNFERLTGAKGTVLDLFDRADFIAYHGKEPPADWQEAKVDDIRRAAGGRFPDFIATSPPCQGYSGLIDNESAESEKYQALNRLTMRGIALCLAAFADNPPSMFLLENVLRIQTRGRALLDTVTQLLRAHGYAVAETTHDCGELGGLSQHRQRFLLVARHVQKVGPHLYQPPRRRVRSIGEALAQLPMPGDALGGAMHRLPALQWKTWMRLALIRAGGDWRSLMSLEVVDGYLRDFCLVADEAAWSPGSHGVREWDCATGAVTTRCYPSNGQFSVADPRSGSATPRFNNVLRLARWSEASPAVTAGAGPTAGGMNVADPRGQQLGSIAARCMCSAGATCRARLPAQRTSRVAAHAVADPRIASYGTHSGKMAVGEWAEPARTVTGADRVGSGAQCIADPRVKTTGTFQSYGVVGWEEAGRTVIGNAAPGSGPYSVADPRTPMRRDKGDAFANAGFYGVKGWDDTANAVTASAKVDTGYWTVADPRALPEPDAKLDPPPLIIALDGTWHRPLTTLELAHLQGYPVFGADGAPLVLEGKSDAVWRKQIGNSVPVGTAEAIGNEVARTLLLEAEGTSFVLTPDAVWVDSFRVAIAMASEVA